MAGGTVTSADEESLISFDRSTLFTIRVGQVPNQREFVVHQDLLSRSEFFRRALNGDWAEATDRVVVLPADKPDVFLRYLNFVYAGKLPQRQVQNDGTVLQPYFALAELYVLAEKLQDLGTKNAAVRHMFEAFKTKKSGTISTFPHFPTITVLYEGTPGGCVIRKLMLDIYSTMRPELVDEFQNKFPTEFVRELAVSLLRERREVQESGGSAMIMGNLALAKGVEAYLEKEK